MKLNTIVQIDAVDIEAWLKEEIERRTQQKVVSLRFDFATTTKGYGLNEHDTQIFTGVHATLAPREGDL